MQKHSKTVYIVESNRQYDALFEREGYTLVRNLSEDTDLVCFTGGADVTPSLYKERPHPRTFCDPVRDEREARIYIKTLDWGIPSVGICRGGQFLNVMNEGKMHQHVVGHATGNHHLLQDLESGNTVMVSSTHHQMMKPGPNSHVLAVADLVKWPEGEEQDDVEVVFYPRTQALCFQPHPEFFDNEHECVRYFFDLINERLI